MKGRKPEPTQLRIIKGNRGKRPLPKHEPKPIVPEELISPEEYLGPDHAAIIMTPSANRAWEIIAPDLHQAGVLTRMDYIALIGMCRCIGDWIDDLTLLDKVKSRLVKTADGGFQMNPIIRSARLTWDIARSMMGSFGMTPSDRTRISVELKKDNNDNSEFYKGIKVAGEKIKAKG